MGSFSIGHWLVILAVVVLLFGAKKIPELAKGVGQGIKDFKKAIKEDKENEAAAAAGVDKVEAKQENIVTPSTTTSTTPPVDEKKAV